MLATAASMVEASLWAARLGDGVLRLAQNCWPLKPDCWMVGSGAALRAVSCCSPKRLQVKEDVRNQRHGAHKIRGN